MFSCGNQENIFFFLRKNKASYDKIQFMLRYVILMHVWLMYGE